MDMEYRGRCREQWIENPHGLLRAATGNRQVMSLDSVDGVIDISMNVFTRRQVYQF
jgi:hypothetical protein